MNDTRTYQIVVQDLLDENDLNAASPIHMEMAVAEGAASMLTVCTDQSSLIGLIRHLHARGLVLLSINSALPDPGPQSKDTDTTIESQTANEYDIMSTDQGHIPAQQPQTLSPP
jgi:hypothetical protein